MNYWLQKIIDQGIKSHPVGSDSWREQVFKIILLIMGFFGIIPYALGMYLSITEHVYIIAGLNTFAYGSVLYIVFSKRISLVYRFYCTIGIVLILGIGLTLILGQVEAGFPYIIEFSVISALLLGLRGAINSLIIIFLFITSIALGLHLNLFGYLTIADYKVLPWLTNSFNVMAVSSMSSIPLAILVRGLESTINHQIDLQHQLEDKIEKLGEAKSKAEEADKLKTLFLANMSHEIRTPLNSIMGFSELVINDLYKNDLEQKEYLNTISQNGSYLLGIIENVLDFSMIESNQLKHSILPFNLNELLTEIQNTYKLDNLSKNHIPVVFYYGQTKPLHIQSDPLRLKQVFINLINNSLKFTKQGEVTAGYWINNDTVLCYVKDKGIGISKEDQSKVFQRFVKIEGEHQVKEGTGLGLPICKGIIETLGGKMWLESEPGVGSTFFFTVPYKNKADYIKN